MQRNILIIGASGGIGHAIAQQQLDTGANLWVISRNRPDLMRDFTYLQADVLSGELPVIEAPIDGLVYCPGSINLKPFKSLRKIDFQSDLELNLLAAIDCLQKYYPNLKEAEQSSVVLFSTVAVKVGMPFHASVAVAKGAIEGLVRSLAAEWSPSIRVNAVAPSITDTPLAARLLRNEKQIEAAAGRHPMQRIGNAIDIAAAASFLISPESSWMTGQVLGVDGGLSTLKKI